MSGLYVCRRSASAPSLIELNDDFIAIPENYVSVMSELDRQRRQIREMKVSQANRELQALTLDGSPDEPEVVCVATCLTVALLGRAGNSGPSLEEIDVPMCSARS